MNRRTSDLIPSYPPTRQHDHPFTHTYTIKSNMSDFYLSAKEAYVLRWATLIWGSLQFWDFFDKRIMQRIRDRNAGTSATPAQGNAEEQAG